MALTIKHFHPYAYVYRDVTWEDVCRDISNGYSSLALELERNPLIYEYARGNMPPNYPMPVLIAPRKYNNDYGNRWKVFEDASNFFCSIGTRAGINWTWRYFLSMDDAYGFDSWCRRIGHETRGVYPASKHTPIGVRHR